MKEGKGQKVKGKSRNEARQRRRLLPFVLFLFTFPLLPAVASRAATKVYAKVDTETAIYPGEDFAYSIVVEGGRPSKIDISPLAAFNPRPTGSGTTMNMVNNRTTVAYSQNYVLTASDAGVMHLPVVTVVVDGQTYATDPVDVTISTPGKTDQMTLEFLVPEKQCYVGQPLVMTIKWVIACRVEDRSLMLDVPVFQSGDFYLEDVSEPAGASPGRQVAVQGVPVTVVESRQLIRGTEANTLSFSKVLIPKQAGHVRLEPLTASANLAVGREPGDFFNPYRYKFQRFSVQSKPIELDVRPLPETDKPPQFYGLVGQYTISASAAPVKVNVGDPITLTIRIGGNPFLKPVQWPALEQVPELAANFKIPAEKASPTLEAGAKVFTQTIRANSDKVTQIPAIRLAYFDPRGRLRRGQDGADQAGGCPVEGADERRCRGHGVGVRRDERCLARTGDSPGPVGELLWAPGAGKPGFLGPVPHRQSRSMPLCGRFRCWP